MGRIVVRILKYTGLTLAVLMAAGVVLFFFGLRVVLDGGGSPHVQFVKSSAARAEELARHRETQRAAAPAPPTAPPAPAPSDASVPRAGDKPVPAAIPLPAIPVPA